MDKLNLEGGFLTIFSRNILLSTPWVAKIKML